MEIPLEIFSKLRFIDECAAHQGSEATKPRRTANIIIAWHKGQGYRAIVQSLKNDKLKKNPASMRTGFLELI
jgi:hypothetical protein